MRLRVWSVGFLAVLVTSAGVGGTAVPAPPAKPGVKPSTDFTKPLDPGALAGKTLAELRWLRNEIYARHGRPFKAYDLHSFFMGAGWYRPDPKYADSRLTPAETANVERVLARERELMAANFSGEGDARRVNVDNVVNPNQFRPLGPEDRERLSRNGFLMLPTPQDQLFYLYENNDYQGIPSFITTDAVLQLYHVFFDYSLRHLEKTHLAAKLEALSTALRDASRTEAKSLAEGPLRTAALRNAAFFEVACAFLADRAPAAEGPEGAKAKAEWDLCRAHAGWAESPLLGKRVDYSLFVPRGHYTRSPELERYFMAMNWFGCMGLDADDDVRLLQGVLMARLLRGKGADGRSLRDAWREIDDLCALFAGPSDDPSPLDYLAIHDAVHDPGAAPAALADPAKLAAFRKQVGELYARKAKITGMGQWGTQKPQLRFLGQRYSPDAEIFQKLTVHDDQRRLFREFPVGLDIMAVLGSARANALLLGELKESWSGWPAYPEALAALARDFRDRGPERWKTDLHARWLWCLAALADRKVRGEGPQFFTTTAGWDLKNLNTALASWSQLRHDTILLTKQSGGAECGGDEKRKQVWIPEPPKGFVEPAAEFYRRLGDNLSFLQQSLRDRKALDEDYGAVLGRFVDLAAFLRTAAEKENAGTVLSLAEYEQIQKMGSLLESMTLDLMMDGQAAMRWAEMYDGPDRKMPVIADVHTWNAEALEVGVGRARALWVIVEHGGLLYLTRGAAFSYYEFRHPSSDRLTDEAWQRMLEGGLAPAPPAWVEPVLSPRPEPELPAPSYVSPSGIPPWSTEPGWKMLYYDTGC
ncbi:MAG: DUF3160 domain-containing protein [Acidobacteria bacterium]|nr:DUF3160 domain-containing protein [Acidobacteriota bacterium]